MWTPTKIGVLLLLLAGVPLHGLPPVMVCFAGEAADEKAEEAAASQRPLVLKELIGEALRANPEIRAAEARLRASQFRIPQARTLPDPMFMLGYQNEGWDRYSYGTEDSWWMYSVSQMVPFPGKLRLKSVMAERDYESLRATYEDLRLMTAARVKELYYELFLAWKEMDIIRENANLFVQIEEAALARYSAGMGMQQEVLMAQTERYMLLERQEMLGQKTEATEAMLNGVLGRVSRAPMGRPEEPPASPEPARFEELLEMHLVHSPLLRSKERMIAGAEARVDMARREYYPDFTFTGTVMNRRDMDDMWSLTAAVNIPIFYGSKQRQGVHEAEASLAEARSELDAAKAMHAAQMRDYYSMEQSSRRLMDLYRNGLIPRARQDFESSLAGYTTGKVEAITAISRLKALLDFEILYWRQFAEREKAVARIEAMQEPVAQGSMTQGGNF